MNALLIKSRLVLALILRFRKNWKCPRARMKTTNCFCKNPSALCKFCISTSMPYFQFSSSFYFNNKCSVQDPIQRKIIKEKILLSKKMISLMIFLLKSSNLTETLKKDKIKKSWFIEARILLKISPKLFFIMQLRNRKSQENYFQIIIKEKNSFLDLNQ